MADKETVWTRRFSKAANSLILKRDIVVRLSLFCIVITFIVLAADCWGLKKHGGGEIIIGAPLKDEWRDNIYGILSFVLSTLSLLISLAIFFYQTKATKESEENFQKVLKNLEELMKDYSPMKSEGEKETINRVLRWIQEDCRKNAYIFYFPYTLVPGFWRDAGSAFITGIVTYLESLKNDDNKDVFIFIGSGLKNTSPFNVAAERLTNEAIIYMEENNPPLWNKFDFEPSDDLEKKKERVRAKYKSKVHGMKVGFKSKRFIKFIELEELQDWEKLPSFSFIMKVTKGKVDEMIFIDTFNSVSSDQHIDDVLKELGINSVENIASSPYTLLRPPNQYILSNPKTTNLFLITFLEACSHGNLKGITDELAAKFN